MFYRNTSVQMPEIKVDKTAVKYIKFWLLVI